MENLKCKLIGHTPHKDFTDSGYEICKVCNKHQYYDSDSWYKAGIIYIPYRYYLDIKWKI